MGRKMELSPDVEKNRLQIAKGETWVEYLDETRDLRGDYYIEAEEQRWEILQKKLGFIAKRLERIDSEYAEALRLERLRR